MSWSDKLKEAGVAIHVVATGAGAGLQQRFWEVPGSSAYLSGASFPYDQSEQEELLGFMPTQFVSEEAAIDLASAAYMKAYRFGGKKPIGIGLTASVASERAHRGDHRVHVCLMTDTQVLSHQYTLEKGIGAEKRKDDGNLCDHIAFNLLTNLLDGRFTNTKDVTELARQRFFERPFFSNNGKRLKEIPNTKNYALMPGSFNPPHEGHLGMANNFRQEHGKNVVFEIGTNPPHKTPPTVQELLQRAKMLRGHDVLFTTDIPMYLQKAKAFPGMPLLVGADTMLRMLDPKWGVDPAELIREFRRLRTKLYVAERMVDGQSIDCDDIVDQLDDILSDEDMDRAYWVIQNLEGRWDVSSSELRAQVK